MFLPMPRVTYRKTIGGKSVLVNPLDRSNDFILDLCEKLDLFVFLSRNHDSIMMRVSLRSNPSKTATFYTWNPDDFVESASVFRRIRRILDEKC
jgi:hypothetical protein